MSDNLRLTMIFPFLLKRFLSVEMVKNDVLEKLKQRNSLRRSSQSITFIVQCWINFSILAKLVFTSTLQDSDYENLFRLSNDFTKIVLKVRLYNDLIMN
jgi:hypothetical protein